VFGDWTYADGEQKAAVLLARHPETNVMWAANDTMAMGALRAVKEKGASVLVGGMGGWPDALASIAGGGLAATAAGNFMIGAWSMVLLYDYHRGRDFAAHGGVNQTFNYVIVNRSNVARYDQLLMRRLNALDVSRYSKVLNPRPGPYRFSLADLVNGAKVR
jgi:ABC-type sugar transport system substrate-binding protein